MSTSWRQHVDQKEINEVVTELTVELGNELTVEEIRELAEHIAYEIDVE